MPCAFAPIAATSAVAAKMFLSFIETFVLYSSTTDLNPGATQAEHIHSHTWA